MPSTPVRSVTVSGQGTSYTVPDSAVVSTAITYRAPSVAEALAGVNSAAEQAVAAAASLVERERVASRDLNIWPAHDNTGRPAGFECRHSLTVRCPSLEVAGQVIGAVAEAVGDRLQVEGVSLVPTDPSAAQAEAREAAYTDAVAKATHLATLAGATLGEPITVVEGGGMHQPMFEMAAARSAKLDTSFEPGQVAVGATLTVTFALSEE